VAVSENVVSRPKLSGLNTPCIEDHYYTPRRHDHDHHHHHHHHHHDQQHGPKISLAESEDQNNVVHFSDFQGFIHKECVPEIKGVYRNCT
jgi:G3E family GTPase